MKIIAQKHDARGKLVMVVEHNGRKRAFTVRRYASGKKMLEAIKEWMASHAGS